MPLYYSLIRRIILHLQIVKKKRAPIPLIKGSVITNERSM
jgi:hypothetical protein